MAIMRTWHGRVNLDKADAYEKFLISKAAPDYGSVDGLLHCFFQRRDEGNISHFFLVTLWRSMQSVENFAGENPTLAKYYQEDDEFLLEKEKHTNLYRVFYQQSANTDSD